MAEQAPPNPTRNQNTPGPPRDDAATPRPLAMRSGNVRFYSSMENHNEASNASANEDTPPTAPGANEQQQEMTSTLEETRGNALRTLALCRSIIAMLEVTRMYKSRLGFCWWTRFWERLYDRALARSLSSRAMRATAKINDLFRAVADDLNRVTQRMENAVRQAGSEQEILLYLEHMEDEVGVRRRHRRKKARMILNRMRASMECIPVKVTDELFDEMKRGVFALDVFCDYHPGDPQAELRDQMGHAQILEHGVPPIESPELYQRWLLAAQGGTVTYAPPGIADGMNLEGGTMPEAIDSVYGGLVSETSSENLTIRPSGECGNLGGSMQRWVAVESFATTNW